MILLAVWIPNIPVGICAVLLTVLGAAVSILEFRGWRRWSLVAAFVILGAGEILMIVKSDAAHTVEVRAQHDDIEKLRGDLQRSEIDRRVSEAYLRAKLEDADLAFSQLAKFAPALMVVAKTGAEFERKQYEVKVSTNKELYEFTTGVVKRCRELSYKYDALDRQQTDEMMSHSRQAKSSEERQKLWQQDSNKTVQLYYDRDAEFRSSILTDALYARNELRKRIPEPPLSELETWEIKLLFEGHLSGLHPELRLADYLELWAKQLYPK